MDRFSLAMETNDIKLLLDSQERAFRSAVDVIVHQFEARISFMETTISDLTTSLEYTQAELQDMKCEAVNLKKSNSDNQSIIQDNDPRTADLEQRLNYEEDYSRRNNLRTTCITQYSTAQHSTVHTLTTCSYFTQSPNMDNPQEKDRHHSLLIR